MQTTHSNCTKWYTNILHLRFIYMKLSSLHRCNSTVCKEMQQTVCKHIIYDNGFQPRWCEMIEFLLEITRLLGVCLSFFVHIVLSSIHLVKEKKLNLYLRLMRIKSLVCKVWWCQIKALSSVPYVWIVEYSWCRCVHWIWLTGHRATECQPIHWKKCDTIC